MSSDDEIEMATASLIVALILLLLGFWPFGPYQASLALARRLGRFPPALDPGGTRPPERDETFAGCLCAYNEARVIRQKIEDLMAHREASGGRSDVLASCGAAQDATAETLSRYADRIRLVVSPERRGKTHGMNRLVEMTDASIAAFTAANVLIDSNAIAVLRRWFADPTIGCRCATYD